MACISVIQWHIRPSILCGISFTNSVNNRCNQMKLYVHSALLLCSVWHLEWCLLWTCECMQQNCHKLNKTCQSNLWLVCTFYAFVHTLRKTNLSSVYFHPWHNIASNIAQCTYIMLHCCILIIYKTYWHAMIYEYVYHVVPHRSRCKMPLYVHPHPLYMWCRKKFEKKINF